MFRRLRTRLTVLYAALFGVTLLLVSLAVFTAVNRAAQDQVRDELAASGTVFDRVWSMRSERLREGASLLSRDFGFREAVATGDQATIVSAMENLRRRFAIDRAFIFGVDGQVIGDGADLGSGDTATLEAAFNAVEDPAGVVMLAGQPHQVVSAPVLSPDLIGWVVFAVRLDAREMASLEKLSAIPLQAAVLHRSADGWRGHSAPAPGDRAAFNSFIDQSLAARRMAPQLFNQGDPAVVLVKPLPTLTDDGSAALLLRYPLSLALAPYRPLLAIVALAGLVGLAVVSWGSWALAGGVTRPISILDAASHRLQRGEDGQVDIESDDEIGRLAASFNTMATEIRDRERRITHLALHDEDTGLPNRRALENMITGAAPRPEGQIYMAALGIQRFDHVRGAIGYALAAQAVRMIGKRLTGLAPMSGAARIATDVLGFILIADTPATAEAEASALMVRLEQPLKVGGDAIDVALNLGLAPLGHAEGSAGAALELANIALDQARAAKRKVAFFDAEAYGDPSSNLSLMSSMVAAFEAGDIALHYQPKYDMRSRAVTGVEALIRWRDPVRGMLSPDLFIPMAEETGHIRMLTEWVVRRAVIDQRVAAEAGHDLSVAVNISGRILGEPDFIPFAREQMQAAVGKLVFEITETAVIENPDLALRMLDDFADAGIEISIDDYGTGLSSLAYLKRIRGHELKIDKAIVQGVTDSQRDALIVRSTIDLAHGLGLKVTAEGVETEEVFALLGAMGCDRAQGWLIARPLPIGELLTFLGQDSLERQSVG